jgi:hypothetical protein
MKFKLATNITFDAKDEDDARNKLAEHFQEKTELDFLGSILFHPVKKTSLKSEPSRSRLKEFFNNRMWW